jgi:hypothetical protein
MLIKVIKDSPEGLRAGQVKDLETHTAKHLIAVGYAEQAYVSTKETGKPVAKPKVTKEA